jgi:putative peptidoglycan lipid II flippase
MAITLSSAAQMLLLWIGLGRRLPSLRLGEILASSVRTGLASVVAGAAGYGAAHALEGLGRGALARAVPGIAGAIVFATAFLVTAYAARSPELYSLVTSLRRRLRR